MKKINVLKLPSSDRTATQHATSSREGLRLENQNSSKMLKLEVAVESPYFDKAGFDAKMGLASQKVKQDNYFTKDGENQDQDQVKAPDQS